MKVKKDRNIEEIEWFVVSQRQRRQQKKVKQGGTEGRVHSMI